MKKLSIVLIEDTTKDPKEAAAPYFPGDTIAGHLTFSTSTSIKYTCIKVRFIGLVSTKVAKTTEEVYVLNQQVVLLGNPNNASDHVLPEGRHSWPFEFKVPLHHIPSSGKYRHGSVRYTLTAFISQKKFLGGMQDIKSNFTVELKDLINCVLEPYCNPVSVQGSSNVKPETNKPKNLAIANVQLARSACLKGQTLQIAIDLTHPKKIQRDPGCWIQLIRKEHYYAGEHAKDYSHVVATSTQALTVDSGTGKILADVKIPDDALPTMITTKIISVQYQLLVMFDMRLRVGFMERRLRRSLNKKQQEKLMAAPGGFQVEIPVVVGTVFDSRHQHRVSPFSAAELQGVGTDGINPITSLVAAASQLSLASLPSSMNDPRATADSPSSSSSPSSASLTPTLSPSYTMAPYTPQTQYKGSSPSAYGSLPLAHGKQTNEPSHHSVLPSSSFDTMSTSRSLHITATSPRTDGIYTKPLPSLPSIATGSRSTPTPPRMLYASPVSSAPSRSPDQTHIPYSSSAASASSPLTSSPLPTVRSADALWSMSSSPSSGSNGYGYPQEKTPISPPHRHLQIQPPMAVQVQSPTAPQAVDLGMGPSSPRAEERQVSQRFSILKPSTTEMDYFQRALPPPPAGVSSASTRPERSLSYGPSAGTMSHQPHYQRSPSQSMIHQSAGQGQVSGRSVVPHPQATWPGPSSSSSHYNQPMMPPPPPSLDRSMPAHASAPRAPQQWDPPQHFPAPAPPYAPSS